MAVCGRAREGEGINPCQNNSGWSQVLLCVPRCCTAGDTETGDSPLKNSPHHGFGGIKESMLLLLSCITRTVHHHDNDVDIG